MLHALLAEAFDSHLFHFVRSNTKKLINGDVHSQSKRNVTQTAMRLLLDPIGNGADQQFPADPRAGRHPEAPGPLLAQFIRAKAAELLELGGQQSIRLTQAVSVPAGKAM